MANDDVAKRQHIFLASLFARCYRSRYSKFEFTGLGHWLGTWRPWRTLTNHGRIHWAILFPGGAARHEKVSPKTWRILGFADATWYLRLQVFTTDQPRCYSFDKVLYPPGFCKKIYGFLVFGTKSSRKIFSFSLVDVGTCKNNDKMFLLTGKN